jgi:hypothetical protein
MPRINEAAVRSLAADLTEWLDTPKVHPATTNPARSKE